MPLCQVADASTLQSSCMNVVVVCGVLKQRCSNRVVSCDFSDYNRESSAQAADQSTMSRNIIVVGFYLGDESIPYRTTVEGPSVTLGQFKQLISKRGNYRSLDKWCFHSCFHICTALCALFKTLV